MKKFIALMLVVAMLGCLNLACAEEDVEEDVDDLGVQIIGGQEEEEIEASPLSLDDMQLESIYTLDDYAVVVPRESKFVEFFAQFGETGDYSAFRKSGAIAEEMDYSIVYSEPKSSLIPQSYRYTDAAWQDSAENAKFFWLLTDVTNLKKEPVNFCDEAAVKVVYRDDYEFQGWVRQISYDHMDRTNGDPGVCRYDHDKEEYPNEIVMNPALVEPIDVMYTGTYVFGCSVPDYVIDDEESPLRIVITMGGNELTYYIRK